MAEPDPSNVAPWYLRNINQALELNEATGQVFVRTGFEGNIIITGNVNIPGNVDAHISEIGTSGNLTVPYMPIAGNITIDAGQSVEVTQGTSPWVVSGNINIDNQATDLTIADSTYEMNVARGLIPGTSSVFKVGYNSSIQNNTEESLWGGSNIYPWSAWGAGGTLSCVSSSASDSGTMDITGLRSSDWVQITETVTLNGTTPVVTSNSFIRINNLHYHGISAAVNVGSISLSRGGTVVGYIEPEFGIAQMAQYTVPAGYTAYLHQGTANMGKGNDGTGKFKYRTYGDSFQTALVFLLYQSTFSYDFSVPLPLPEKTDLDVTMFASVSGTACSCQYDMILIANT
jgi:hypothetical protein